MERAQSATVNMKVGAHPAHILVVDDEEIVRQNIERILASLGYSVDSAQSGNEALELMHHEEYDLVITDMVMPGLDGLAFLEEIKRFAPETVVIIITGYGSVSSAVKVMQKGAFDYLIKPCERDELIFRVNKALDRRELEKKLLEMKKMEAILSNVAVYTLDDKGMILSGSSPININLWGEPEPVGKNLEDLPGIKESGLLESFHQGLAGQEVNRDNIRYYAPKTRREYILSCHFRPILGKGGEVKNLVMVLEDVTRRTRIMQQIGQAEKLAALGKLAAGVAHEINNPLNIISLDVEFLKSQLAPNSSMIESLNSINEEVDRIAHIVQQLQDHAKIEETLHERINLNALLRGHIFAVVFSQLAKKEITVNLELDESLPEVLIPKNKLTQVFMNLIKNAEDAMPQGGTLTVTTQRVGKDQHLFEMRPEAGGGFERLKDFIEVVITDTGVGIKKEDLNYLFEPFFTTKGFDGTGLGLFISYSIIKSYNGLIRVESKVGEGTSFYIILPSTNGKEVPNAG